MMRWIWFILNLAVIAVLGLAYAAPYLDPRAFWPAAMAGLIFPILIILNGFFLFGWLVFQRWIFALIAALAFVPAIREFSHYIGFGPSNNNREVKAESDTLRVLSWNVRVFNKNSVYIRFAGRDSMLALIAKEQPDLICMQEYFTIPGSAEDDHEKLVREASGLPHYSLWEGLHDIRGRQWGLAIFSRYPIVEKGEVDFPGDGELNACQYVDIKGPAGRFRVFNTHLQSIHLSTTNYGIEEAVSEMSESDTRRATLRKFRDAYKVRADQAVLIEDAVLDSPWPVIVCGDFNDPPQSYSYQRIASGLQDAFATSGRGLARTHTTLPGVRIDYVLVDTAMSVLSYRAPQSLLSDHYPVMVEVGM